MARTTINKIEFDSHYNLAAGFGVSDVITFTNRIFNFDLEIKPIHRDMEFINCHFNRKVTFLKGYKVVNIVDNLNENLFAHANYETNAFEAKVTFKENCKFGDDLITKGIVFKDNFRIHDCEVTKLNFENTIFENLADFWSTKFIQKVVFLKTDFKATTVFSMATFEEDVLFTYSLLAGKSIFSKTEFKKGLDLSQAIISGDLKLFDIHFENDKFQTQYFKRLQKLEYQNAIDNLAIIPTENKVHTFQILRKAYEDVGNYDDATKMRRAEKIALRELTQEKKRDSQHASSTLGDRLILWLNRWSNNFRSDFRNGLTFTGVTAVLFASITLLLTESFYNNICWGCNFDFETFSDGIAFIFRFLNPTHRIDYLDPLNPFLGIAYLFDFLGRIFVGYGIYQTIQAFRKFK